MNSFTASSPWLRVPALPRVPRLVASNSLTGMRLR